jgi:ribulose kinase
MRRIERIDGGGIMDALQKHLDELMDEADYLRYELENFCEQEGCEPMIDYDWFEYWGRMVKREYQACIKGEICCHLKQYQRMEETLESIESQIVKLEQKEAATC